MNTRLNPIIGSFIVSIFFLTGAAQTTQAALITFEFSGEITGLGQVNSYGGTSIGSTFSGSVTFDGAVTGSSGIYLFSGGGNQVSTTIGTETILITDFRIEVGNNIGSSGTDDTYVILGSEGSSNSDTTFKIALIDSNGTIFSDQSLPTTPPSLLAIESDNSNVREQNPTTTNPYSDFELTSLTVAVPVPASVWLFGSGLGLLVWMKRRAA